jgi:hypothetical protein
MEVCTGVETLLLPQEGAGVLEGADLQPASINFQNRSSDPDLASYLRIEERELEAGGLN